MKRIKFLVVATLVLLYACTSTNITHTWKSENVPAKKINKLLVVGIQEDSDIGKKEKEKHYVPARIYYSPYVMYHRHFWGYYNTMYTRIYSPGYYVEDQRYFWESNLYDISNKELIYSVQTESYNPGSTKQLAHEYGELIVNDMIKNKVLVKN